MTTTITVPPPPPSASSIVTAVVVDEQSTPLTLAELCHACCVSQQDIEAWVAENVVEPAGSGPHEWTFGGASLHRALVAARLARDLQVSCSDLGLVLDLLDEIGRLKALLRQRGAA